MLANVEVVEEVQVVEDKPEAEGLSTPVPRCTGELLVCDLLADCSDINRPADGIQPGPDGQVDVLESQLAPPGGKGSLDVSKPSLSQDTPYRPGYGTRGIPVVLWANYFQILPTPNVSIFRYDVNITPGVQQRRLKARIFELLLTDDVLSDLAPGIISVFIDSMVMRLWFATANQCVLVMHELRSARLRDGPWNT